MTKKINPYKKYLRIAFIINTIGIILSFTFKGSLGVFGTILIMLAVVLAIIGMVKKKKYEQLENQ